MLFTDPTTKFYLFEPSLSTSLINIIMFILLECMKLKIVITLMTRLELLWHVI